MKKIASAVIGIMVFVMLHTISYAFQYVHEDDFEEESLSGYTVSAKNGATAQIVSDGEDNHVLQMTSSGSNLSLVQTSFDSISNIAVFDMDFIRESEDGGSIRVMQIYDSKKQNRPFLLTASKTGLVVRIGERMSTLVVPDYTIGEWMHLRAVLNFNTKTYDFYVNGKQYCSGNEFFQSAAEDAGMIQLQIDGGTGIGVCKADNLAFYGINNEEIDSAVLETEKELSSYTIGNGEGDYSYTRYQMFKDRLSEIRQITRTVLSAEEIASVSEQLENAKSEFEAGKFYPESAEGTVELLPNEIDFPEDGATVFTSEDGTIEHSLNVSVTDNFGREYPCEPSWRLLQTVEGMQLDGNRLLILSGTMGRLKLRAAVDTIYRDFSLYLRDYSRVKLTEVTAANGAVTIKGTLIRNSDDAVTLEVQIGENRYGSIITEDEDGSFECTFEIPEEILTSDGIITASGEYVHELKQSFLYFAADAADAALNRIQNGIDEQISETVKAFADYLSVHSDTFADYEKEYVAMIRADIPYATADALNQRLSEINLILEISNAVRADIKEIITSNLELLKTNGFDVQLYEKLSDKNRDQFYTNAVSVQSNNLGTICSLLNEIMKKCNTTQPVSPGGGGGGSRGGSSFGGTTGSSTDANRYVVTPVEEDKKPTENLPEEPVKEFEDVNEAEWAKEAMQYLRKLGIVEGYENRIRPNDPVTRGEIAKMLVQAFRIAEDTQVTENGLWWQPYAQRGMAAGIINGYADGDFHGEDLLVRQDLAVLLSRIIQYRKIPAYDTESEKNFYDEGEISDYAKQAVGDLQKYGILSGIGENMFAPHAYVTRAQAITAIYNVLQVESGAEK